MRDLTIDIGALQLDDGSLLPSVEQHVTIAGTPSADGENVVLVLHALTGSSRAAEWWPGIIGNDALFDQREWCIVGVNVLGGCYGSTGPSNRPSFPRVTVRDMVRAQRRTIDELGIGRFHFAIGGSLGGMQALQWALDVPERVAHAVAIGAHDHQSPMAIALNAIQREASRSIPYADWVRRVKSRCFRISREEFFTNATAAAPIRSTNRASISKATSNTKPIILSADGRGNYETLTHAMDSFDVRNGPRPAGPP